MKETIMTWFPTVLLVLFFVLVVVAIVAAVRGHRRSSGRSGYATWLLWALLCFLMASELFFRDGSAGKFWLYLVDGAVILIITAIELWVYLKNKKKSKNK